MNKDSSYYYYYYYKTNDIFLVDFVKCSISSNISESIEIIINYYVFLYVNVSTKVNGLVLNNATKKMIQLQHIDRSRLNTVSFN